MDGAPPVLFEDEYLLVVNKAAGMVIHPAYRNPDGTLLDALRSMPGWTAPERPSIVGRLDRLTSGIVIVARTAAVHASLQETLARDGSEKIYAALVEGVPPAWGVIDAPLAADPIDRRRRIVSPTGAPSRTVFNRIRVLHRAAGPWSLLECRLLTGRRHQIRVHLASRAWPIVGDAVYGRTLDGFPRHALHSWRAAFAHPVTGARVRVQAPLPAEFEALMSEGRLAGTSGFS
jgi:23S rRNA pseudouridine1911/1915/1917 synthase